MREILDRYIRKFHRDHQKRRKAIALFVVLSLLVSGSVTWRLKSDGIAMTNEAFCGKEEHQHSEACYTEVLTCGLEETEGHHHSKEAGCYAEEKTLICTEKEHTHGDECYDEEGNLICLEMEHTHDGTCYQTAEVLACDKPETEGHTHSESCYTKELTCGKEEHIHTAECYSDNQADVETAADWEKTLPADLGGGWAENVVKVAASQLGYAESTKNYQLSESDGTSHKGYTRYGAWYGNDYGDWSAMFVSFCLKYAGVPESAVPYAAGAYAWTTALNEKGLYHDKAYTAKAGDIVFLDKDEDGRAERVGVVEKTSEDGKKIKTIEGDCEKDGADVVAEMTYTADDEKIVGYGEMAVNPEAKEGETAAAEGQPEENAEKESTGNESTAADDAVPEAEQKAKESIAVQAGSSANLIDYKVKKVGIEKLVNGEWKTLGDGETLTEGDKVKIDIEYLINGGIPDDVTELLYQIPKNFKFENEMTGPVMQDGKTVGHYTIDKDGLVTISLDRTVFDPKQSFAGDIFCEGTVNKTGTEDSETIVFPGSNDQITIEKDKSKYDLNISKDGKLSDDGKSITYTVTAWSESGTFDEKVSIKDILNLTQGEDNLQAEYDGKFTIKKVSGDGTETIVNTVPDVGKGSDGKPYFEVKDLDPLGKNEKYEVTYTVDITQENAAGGGSVGNSAGVYTKDKNKWTYDETKVPHTMMEKSGWYDSDKKVINWTIKVNGDKSTSLDGYELKDILPNGTELAPGESISISPSLKGNNMIDKLDGFVFPEGAGNEAYTISYKTTVPDIQNDETHNLKNTASIEKGDDGPYRDDATVGVKLRPGDVSKWFSKEETTENGETLYEWKTRMTLPEKGTTEILYEDKILDTKDQNGNTVVTADGKNPHYGIASELMKQLKESFSFTLEDNTKLTYEEAVAKGYDISIHFYEDEQKKAEIQADDSTSEVRYFTVSVTKKGEKINGKYLEYQYRTHVDYSEMQEGMKWKFQNKGIYGEKESTTEHTHEILEQMIKQVGYKDNYGNLKYQTGDLSVKYENISDGYLYYRILISTRADQNEDIVITDELGDSNLAFEENEDGTPDVTVNFYNKWNDFGDWGNNWDSCGNYNLSTAKKVVNGQTLTVTIPGGYNTCSQAPHSFSIWYKVKIKDDIDWKDPGLTTKQYDNTASWGEVTKKVTTTVGDREVKNVSKSAVQKKETVNGVERYTDAIEYNVVINPAKKDLNTKGDTIELTDQLSSDDSNVKAYLDLESVKLYYYDADVEGNKGQLVDRSLYQTTYDENSVNNGTGNRPSLKITIPDEEAFVLSYTYSFERGSKNEPKISNEIKFAGETASNVSTSLQSNQSGASVHHGSITISKVDADDISTKLEGAKFTLEEYDPDKQIFQPTEAALAGDGTKMTENGQTVYVTGTSGILKFESALDESQSTVLKENTIYRLTEIEAPTGYEKNGIPYYFVFLKKNQTENEINAIRQLMDQAVQKGRDGEKKYYGSSVEASLIVKNKFQGVSARKIWQDADGNEISDPSNCPEIQVQLYQQKTVHKGNRVTFKAVNDNDMFEKTVYVKQDGTVNLILKVQDWNNNPLLAQILEEHGFQKVKSDGVIDDYSKTITVSQEETIEINPHEENSQLPTWNWGLKGAEIEGDDIEEGYDTILESKKAIGTSVTLNQSNNWSFTWDHTLYPDLEENDADGNPYYYTIEEVGVPGGYDVTYRNNNGVGLGDKEIVAINRRKPGQYTLPKTGGPGTNVYTAGGLAIMLAAGLVYKKKKSKKGDRGLSG